MDLVASCKDFFRFYRDRCGTVHEVLYSMLNQHKDKLAYFRIKELKDILTQMSLSKQGKKQDLIDRILKTFPDEEDSRMQAKKHAGRKEGVANLIDDIYRKLHTSGTTDVALKGQGLSDGSNVKVKSEVEHRVKPDTKVRCLCGNFVEAGSMIKCEDRRCNVWQHRCCVLIPHKPMERDPPVPDLFYCEICRLNRADPFWLSVAHPLFPVKLTAANIPTDGTNPVQRVEKTFQLTRANKDLLAKQEYDIQAWCMLLNDKVPYRMQWPQYADLHINGVSLRVINRPGSQLLGANGRDDGPIITPCTKDGINRICLTGCDARIFCFGVRIVKRRTVPQILNLIPKESDGERFEDALARVRRCIGGGTSTDNADSDSDIEVVADSFGINLRCPMSGSRMKVAGRFKACAHMGCFDLEVFVELNQRSRKWQCPICLKNYSLEYIIIDPYFNRITSLMRDCEEDVTEIEAKPDGSWRVKVKSESERSDLGDLGLWHSPDGIVCAPVEENVKPNLDALKQIEQEGYSVSHTGLKLGIRKNRNGFWEVSKPEGANTLSGNKFQEKLANNDQKGIPMSSSATGSRSGEDLSVNQGGGGGNFNIPGYIGFELDSMSLNHDSSNVFANCNPSAQFGNAEVILLSGSENEDDMLISSEAAYKQNGSGAGAPFSVPHTAMDPYPEDHSLGNGGSSCLGLFNTTEDEFGLPLWPLLPGTQGGHAFQLFGSDTVFSDSLVDLQHGSINCPPLMSDYTLAPDAALESASLVPNSLAGCSDTGMNNGLVDNHFPFGGDDPSLQIFLPTRPSDASTQSDLRNHADVSNGMHSNDWISLRLGGSDRESTAFNELTLRHQIPSREGAAVDTDTVSLPFGMNNSRSEKSSRQRSDSLFSFPRQKRSVRPRLNLSIDSDSE